MDIERKLELFLLDDVIPYRLKPEQVREAARCIVGIFEGENWMRYGDCPECLEREVGLSG